MTFPVKRHAYVNHDVSLPYFKNLNDFTWEEKISSNASIFNNNEDVSRAHTYSKFLKARCLLSSTFLYNLQMPFVRNFDLEAETSEQY